jgi:glycosyltransferase involved in cell wall biosynthesis
VIAVTPNLAGGVVGLVKASLTPRARFALIVQDLVGAGAVQSGSAGNAVGRVVAGVEKFVARRADAVWAVLPAFVSVLREWGVEESRIHLFRNWAHVSPPRKDRDEVRASLGWAQDDEIILHAGNMGAKQGLDQVIYVATRALAALPQSRFGLMGDGNERRALEAAAAGIPNVTFMPAAAEEEFPEILAAADVLLLSERPSLRDMSLPSKLTSYSVAERPIVAMVRADGATATEVRDSELGIVVAPDEPTRVLEALDRVQREWAERAPANSAGSRYSRSRAMARLDELVQLL